MIPLLGNFKMRVEIRQATADDIPLLEGFIRAYHDFEGVVHPEVDIVAAIRPLLGESASGRIFLICDEGTAVGYIALCFGYTIEFGGRDAFVDELFIAEPHRGRGIGKAALALVKAAAGSLGVRALHLEVARSNESAQRLYRSAGFVARDRFFLMSAPIPVPGVRQRAAGDDQLATPADHV